jgi:hypothetical protein
MNMTIETREAICCPKFDPEPWDGKTVEWKEKRFIRDRVMTAFYMPLNFGAAMKRMTGKVEGLGAQVPDWLCLSEHTTKWNMDVYLAVDREVPGAENVTLSGTFFCKVYEGDFKDTGKWMKDFSSRITDRGLQPERTFLWYTTCPKCAKKYGRNYVVLLARV